MYISNSDIGSKLWQFLIFFRSYFVNFKMHINLRKKLSYMLINHATRLEILKNTVTFKPGLGVTEGH